MKLFISADMEGVAGVSAWQDVNQGNGYYEYFRRQMTEEIVAICQVAKQSGFDEILVKDAHDSARNILMDLLPMGVKLFSNWAKDPFIMMAGLDADFDAIMYTGYHAGAYFDGNPLAHTMSSSRFLYVKLNDVYLSEFLLNSYIGAYFKVPVIAITGDATICRYAQEVIPNITPMPLKEGHGAGMISLGKEEALHMLREKSKIAFAKDFSTCQLPLPAHFTCEICFKDWTLAHGASFYTGVQRKDANTIVYETHDFYEFLKFFFYI